MATQIDYPRGSLKKSLEIAKAVSELGGSCTPATCADHLGKQISGSFNAQVSAAGKFGFITSKKGVLYITDFFRKLNLAYDDSERIELLQDAFFKIPLFSQLYERFKNGVLPKKMLDKILIREFDVPENSATRIATYFINSASEVNLLNPDLTFQKYDDSSNGDDENSQESITEEELKSSTHDRKGKDGGNKFSITIDGPGINFRKDITCINDFLIINAILESVKTNFKESEDNE
ncbi:MAG: hypothetical protein IH852_14200 [Bacteroidetes bacterium]|nr:hypothetical protein [Bacteroidota bacterium]